MFFLMQASLLSIHVGSVGIKRRIAEADAARAAASSGAACGSAASGTGGPVVHRPQSIKRRIAEADIETGSLDLEAQQPTPHFLKLKRDWAKGKLSAKDIQEHALTAMQSGARGVEQMAKMGNWGDNPRNMARALVHALGMPAGSPQFDWFEIPLKSGPKSPHPFLLPHEFFKSLYATDRKHFIRAIRGPQGAALQFWQQLRDTPFLMKHPDLSERYWSSTIPLGIHGDGGSFSKPDQLYVITWNSLLGDGPTLLQRFLLTVVRDSQMVDDTLDAVFEILSWSMNVLLQGESPSRRWEVPEREAVVIRYAMDDMVHCAK